MKLLFTIDSVTVSEIDHEWQTKAITNALNRNHLNYKVVDGNFRVYPMPLLFALDFMQLVSIETLTTFSYDEKENVWISS